jgi:hypothetical protein
MFAGNCGLKVGTYNVLAGVQLLSCDVFGGMHRPFAGTHQLFADMHISIYWLQQTTVHKCFPLKFFSYPQKQKSLGTVSRPDGEWISWSQMSIEE